MAVHADMRAVPAELLQCIMTIERSVLNVFFVLSQGSQTWRHQLRWVLARGFTSRCSSTGNNRSRLHHLEARAEPIVARLEELRLSLVRAIARGHSASLVEALALLDDLRHVERILVTHVG